MYGGSSPCNITVQLKQPFSQQRKIMAPGAHKLSPETVVWEMALYLSTWLLLSLERAHMCGTPHPLHYWLTPFLDGLSAPAYPDLSASSHSYSLSLHFILGRDDTDSSGAGWPWIHCCALCLSFLICEMWILSAFLTGL
jgi:hypothetical protein